MEAGHPHDVRPESRSELTKRLKEVEVGLERFQRAFRVLAMGVDYQRYARFELLVPQVVWFMTGTGRYVLFPGSTLFVLGSYGHCLTG